MTSIRILESPAARDVLRLVINNDMESALELCRSKRKEEISMEAKLGFITFLKAIVTFDKDHCSAALETLADTERRCSEIERAGTPDGVVGSAANWMLWRTPQKRAPLSHEEATTLGVLKGDCELFMAVLNMLNMDITGFVKGGWLIRKAYKHYESCYDAALKNASPAGHGHGGLATSRSMPQLGTADSSKKKHKRASPEMGSSAAQSDQEDVAASLLGNASFGFGLFNLLVSLLSPQVLRLIQFLGFTGDRSVGLNCLQTCASTPCSKQPLAVLALLNYHSTVRPFLNLDGGDIVGGVPEARRLLARFGPVFPDSSLVHFFRGRLERLEGRLDDAIRIYAEASDKPGCWDEVKSLCTYETAWCHLLSRRFANAAVLFEAQKNRTNWSKSFFAYLEGLCWGAATGEDAQSEDGQASNRERLLENREKALQLIAFVPSMVQKKNNQVEAFVAHRSLAVLDSTELGHRRERFDDENEHFSDVCTLYALECVYQWNAHPSVGRADAAAFQSVLRRLRTGGVDVHLCLLLKSCLENVARKRKNMSVADERERDDDGGGQSVAIDDLLHAFDDAADAASDVKNESHVTASALYEKAVLLMELAEREEGESDELDSSSSSKRRDDALRILNLVKTNFTGCQLENRISMRAHAALQKSMEN